MVRLSFNQCINFIYKNMWIIIKFNHFKHFYSISLPYYTITLVKIKIWIIIFDIKINIFIIFAISWVFSETHIEKYFHFYRYQIFKMPDRFLQQLFDHKLFLINYQIIPHLNHFFEIYQIFEKAYQHRYHIFTLHKLVYLSRW